MRLLPVTQYCGLHMRRECRERFPSHRGLAIPACVTARDTRAVIHAGIANYQFPLKSGKRYRHSRRMCNHQFCVFGKRPIGNENIANGGMDFFPFNPLAPGWHGSKSVSSEHMLPVKFMSNSCQITLRWVPKITFDDKSILVQPIP